MKLRLFLAVLSVIVLAACGSPQPAPVPTAATSPAQPPTPVPPSPLPDTAMPPTDTVVPATATAVAPLQPPTDTPLPPTATATVRPRARATVPRPTATSAGPLSANIYVANCRRVPTSDKPGRIVVQISVEASGGNGKYRYFYSDKESPTKFIDVIGEKGTRLVGEVKVISGDGQTFSKPFDVGLGSLDCS